MRGASLVLFSLDGTYQDGGEAPGGTVEVAGTLSHVGEDEGGASSGARLPHPLVIVDTGTPSLIRAVSGPALHGV